MSQIYKVINLSLKSNANFNLSCTAKIQQVSQKASKIAIYFIDFALTMKVFVFFLRQGLCSY